jgi:hypothetical protein
MLGQMDGMMRNSMNQALQGQASNPEAKEFAEHFQKKMMDNIKTELSWEKLKDLYVQVYAETFTQEEIDGLLAFYQSPAGKAFVSKMPLAMQKTMTLMQGRIQPMMQNLQKSIEDAKEEIKGIKKKD